MNSESQLQAPAPLRTPIRLHHLDALRGLAAVVVVLHHFRSMFTVLPPPIYLQPFFAGGKSVTLFFVLSGFVLSLPYWNGRQPSYGNYLVRRFCRIYLPYVGALLLAVLVGSQLLYARLPLTRWFYGTWHDALSLKLVALQLIFAYGKHDGAAINMAFWSLRYEVEMSIAFPLVCWFILRIPVLWSLAFAAALDYAGMERLPQLIPASMHEFTNTLLWCSAFIFGAILAKKREAIRTLYFSIGVVGRYILLALVVVGFYRGESAELVNIPAACGVIIIADCSRAHRWLGTNVPIYLGRISYSLYLLHSTVLLATLILLYNKVSLLIIAITYLGVTFAVSHLYCKFVEETSSQLGKRLTA